MLTIIVKSPRKGSSPPWGFLCADLRTEDRVQFVGTRHAVSANAKVVIVDVSDTARRVPTSSLHLSHFRFPFVIPQLCPSKLGGRAKRRGYVKKNRERMSGERGNIPPSGALLLVPLTQRDRVDGHVKPETWLPAPSVLCYLSSVLCPLSHKFTILSIMAFARSMAELSREAR